MTEQTGANQPPDWYRNPPEWLREPPARRGRNRDYDDDQEDSYRDRGYRRRDRDYDTMRDLEQKISGMPEAVVNALKEAIQGATQQRQSSEQQQQQKPPEQQQSSSSDGKGDSGGDDKPGEQLTWGEKFLMNKL